MNKLFIKTWGCQMNVYDSARMVDIVLPLGYEMAEKPEEADIVILNTCHIREKASEKLFSELGRLRKIKEQRAVMGNKTLIAVAGCVAQALGEEILRRAPFVDMVFGPQTYHRLPAMIAEASQRDGGVIDTDFPPEPKFDFLPKPQTNTKISAFLTIQEGCDKFCSYCVVPYTRGAEYSRPAADIISETKILVEKGAQEIFLLGQNVNAYDDGKTNFAKLLKLIAEIPGVLRIRYTTSHPLDMGDDLIALHRDLPKLMPFLHLPVQSGSDKILAAMNRKHTAKDYLHIVDKLRAARPDIAISTDFIVGFPGETDADFYSTMELARDVGFAQAYSFKYSRRFGTPAATFSDQVSAVLKKERLSELQALLNEQQEKFNKMFVNKTLPVLFESAGNNAKKGIIFGRTPYWQAVETKGTDDMIGKEIMVSIASAGRTVLKGEIVN